MGWAERNEAFDHHAESAVLTSAFFVFFSGSFFVWWRLSQRMSTSFNDLDLPAKANWCSRANSTVHALVIVTAVSLCLLLDPWSDAEVAEGMPTACRRAFCFSIAYFLTDTWIMLAYKPENWYVFVAHHVFAATPYTVAVFVPGCAQGALVLAAFLLVELPTLSLNFSGYMDECGRASSPWYAASFYTTFGLWMVTRLVVPIVLLVVVFGIVWPGFGGNKMCLIPSIVCAFGIVLFCWAVFFTVLVPDLRDRWRARQDSPTGDAIDVEIGGDPEQTMLSGGGRAPLRRTSSWHE